MALRELPRRPGAPLLIVTSEPVARAAALLADTLAAIDSPRLAVPGGSAAAAVGPLRAALAGGRWSRARLTFTDERCAPADSNRGALYRSGALAHDDPPAVELALWLEGEDAEQALARVRRGLERDFDSGLDAVLLGLGPDGHVASLFPGRPARTGLCAYVKDSPKPPAQRITLTRALFASAKRVVVLATGESKRAALERLLSGDPALPASGLPGLTIVTDLSIEEGSA